MTSYTQTIKSSNEEDWSTAMDVSDLFHRSFGTVFY